MCMIFPSDSRVWREKRAGQIFADYIYAGSRGRKRMKRGKGLEMG